MARIIERNDGTLEVLVHLTLKPGRDDEIIRLILSAPNGYLAGVVREAMRTGIGEKQVELQVHEEDILDLPDLGIDL